MRIEDLVDAVCSGKAQPSGDLEQFVEGVADGSVSIEDATSWLKAVHQHGMPTEDTVVLTKSMIASGASLSWGEGPPVVDKHSTGGVGDKMSLVLAPALAAAGCRVPMLAGRGLGHTGGTIDKLEAIPGFRLCTFTRSHGKRRQYGRMLHRRPKRCHCSSGRRVVRHSRCHGHD